MQNPPNEGPQSGFLDSGKVGAATRIRTGDPRITNALLYQLSYCGMPLKGAAF
jgi:hypothetical protein